MFFFLSEICRTLLHLASLLGRKLERHGVFVVTIDLLERFGAIRSGDALLLKLPVKRYARLAAPSMALADPLLGKDGIVEQPAGSKIVEDFVNQLCRVFRIEQPSPQLVFGTGTVIQQPERAIANGAFVLLAFTIKQRLVVAFREIGQRRR